YFVRACKLQRHGRPGVEIRSRALRAGADEVIRRGAYHRRVVGAILQLRIEDLSTRLFPPLAETGAQAFVGAHASGDGDFLRPGTLRRALRRTEKLLHRAL